MKTLIKEIIYGLKHQLTYRKKNHKKSEILANYKKYFDNSFSNKKNQTKVVVQKLSKVYGNGVKALSDVSLKINPGEFVVLLGPSGCGKTTLLRMIAGLESISDGYVKFNESIVNSMSPKDREIAMVFQNYALYPFMSIYSNISFGLKNKLYSNNVYRKFKYEIKVANNDDYEAIQDLKIKIKLLKSVDNSLIDNKNRFKRLLKVAKINKDENKIIEYQNEINSINKKITKFKNNSDIKKQVLKCHNEILKIKKSHKQIDYRKSNKIRSEKVKSLIQEKFKIAKVWNDYIPQKIETVTKMLGINMYTKRKPADLSGGQRQRVALARAISKQSGLFLYDEPLSNLDAKLRSRMRGEIRRIHESLGSTSIYVTHDQLEAMSMADKIVVINKGYIQQVGTPLELLEKPHNLFVAKFIGNTNVNIISVKYLKKSLFLTKNGEKIEITSGNKKIKPKDLPSKLVMTFRPEHLIVDPQIVRNFKINKFIGKVKFLELLGNDVLLTLHVPKLGDIRVMSTISYKHKIGDEVPFIINPNKLHVYDDITGFNVFEKFDDENEEAKKVWLNSVDERKKNIYLMNKEKNKISLLQKLALKILSPISQIAKEKLDIINSKIDYGDQKKAN